ncbi:DUF502 domain-containing protein [Haladaptatus sp. GCM10025707]|uniref:DUF502 domain-containing protein n=1 Tax=unclassified Haladaptatus TaxID=2622732 RepID=UPI0023E86DDD|nr:MULTISPECIES: DUF502 domain-containing protein [unclassified Haladaptatus]
MASWKRDMASGLVVLIPILVVAYVVFRLYVLIASISGFANIEPIWLGVILTLIVFSLFVLSVGYLMRTAFGSFVEETIDSAMNRLPGLRIVYNASKMAIETALTGTEDLQKPVKVETWDGLRMTAFKTGKMAPDGREVLFLPTSPNITTGFVIEAESDRFEEIDEKVEDALIRVLSAGFGENRDKAGVKIDVHEDGETPTPGDDD